MDSLVQYYIDPKKHRLPPYQQQLKKALNQKTKHNQSKRWDRTLLRQLILIKKKKETPLPTQDSIDGWMEKK